LIGEQPAAERVAILLTGSIWDLLSLEAREEIREAAYESLGGVVVITSPTALEI
jgi:hypothetical protein